MDEAPGLDWLKFPTLAELERDAPGVSDGCRAWRPLMWIRAHA